MSQKVNMKGSHIVSQKISWHLVQINKQSKKKTLQNLLSVPLKNFKENSFFFPNNGGREVENRENEKIQKVVNSCLIAASILSYPVNGSTSRTWQKIELPLT